MIRLFVILLFFYCTLQNNHAQQLPFSINKSPVDWSKWEIKLAKEEKLKLIEKLNRSVEIEYGLNYYNYTVSNILDAYHIIDFNHDGYYDIVYNGFAGVSNNGIMFYENREGIYVRYLSMFGDIVEIWQSDSWAPLSFKILNYRCCGNYVSFLETYVPELTYNLNVKYVISNKITFVDGTAIPEKFEKYIPFKTTKENSFLCIAPSSDTTSYNFLYKKQPVVDKIPQNTLFNFKGVVTANFKKEAQGIILAEKKDEAGMLWFFVMINPDKIIESVFCSKGDNNSSAYFVMGWMQSNAVEKILLEGTP